MSSVTVEVSSSQVVWKLENFSRLNAYVLCKDSDVFSVGSFRWKARIFPKGVGVYDHLSLYLVPVDPIRTASVEFSFEIASQSGRKNKKRREARLKLKEGTITDKGFPKFMRLSELYDPKKGYIVDDTCVIRIKVTCRTTRDSIDSYMKEMETLRTKVEGLLSPLHYGANLS